MTVQAVLEQLGTCGVSDALEAAGRRPRPVAGLRPLTTSRVIAGRASTVQLAPMARGEPLPERHLGAAAVDAGGEDTVVVVAVAGDPAISGAWGGLLSLAAHGRGIRGTVVGGLCRDTDEIRALGYPVYGLGSTVTTARGRLKEVAVGIDVTMAGATVSPGDHVVADGDGVLVVPASDTDALVGAGQRMLVAEAGLADRIRAGEPLASVLGGSYESLTRGAGASDA